MNRDECAAATPSLREDVSVIRTSLSVRDYVAHRALDRIEHRIAVLLREQEEAKSRV